MLSTIFNLLLAFTLVIINGFFVLAEFAIVKVRRTKLEELANQNIRKAKVALKISHNLDSYLSAIQLGITLASLALGWLGQPAVSAILQPLFDKFLSNNELLAHSISLLVAFIFITLMHVVAGELVPKSLAIQKAESMALFVAYPLYLFHKITYPVVYIFDRIAALTLKLIGITQDNEAEQAHSEEEIRMIVNASQKGGILDDTEGTLIGNVFTFSDRKVDEIMVPRTDMIVLNYSNSYEENMHVMLNSNFTRFPLCIDSKDTIIGVIHLRDMLENETKRANKIKDLKVLMREILFVPETLNISSTMQLMRKKHIHLAVVVDEYGGTAGLISLEDIIEEIVGEIQDEYDHEEAHVDYLDDSTYIISGLMLQEDVEKLLKTNLGDQDDETIGGVVFSKLGRKPEVGDVVYINNFIFEVISIDKLRIDKLKVYSDHCALSYD